MHPIGIRIRRARQQADLSQSNLSDQVGVHRSAVAQWERDGGTSPSVEHLVKIATVTRVTLDWLIRGSGPMRSTDEAVPATVREEYAQDMMESRLLLGFRRLPSRARAALLALIDALHR